MTWTILYIVVLCGLGVLNFYNALQQAKKDNMGLACISLIAGVVASLAIGLEGLFYGCRK